MSIIHLEVSMRTTVCCTALLLTFSAAVFGQRAVGTESWNRAVELRSHFCMNQQEDSSVPESVAPLPGRKNPAVGILLSAAVPGAGEIYAGSWIKGVIFLGIETGLWIGYVQFYNKGKDWEDIFHVYADEHWSEDKWKDSTYPTQTS